MNRDPSRPPPAEPAPAPAGPAQPHPPALMFRCPDGDGWTWWAGDARDYQQRLDRAWRRHLNDAHIPQPVQGTLW